MASSTKSHSSYNMAPPKGGEDHSGYHDVEQASNNDEKATRSTGGANHFSPRRNAGRNTVQKEEIQGLLSHLQKNNSNNLPPNPEKPPSSPRVASALNTMAGSTVQEKAISACILYSVCSVSMVLTNKSLASSYRDLTPIDLNFLLVVFQAIFAVICVEFSKRMNWVEYPALTMETIKLWVPVNLFFCFMLFTGMASLQHNSVPMVTIFKNITNIMVAGGDFFFFNASIEMLVAASFAVTLGGAVAAAWNDISSSWTGLLWMAANCVASAGYVLYMKFATKNIKLSKFGMVFVNNLLCICFLLPVATFKGEVGAFFSTPAIHTFDYFSKNCLAGFMGFFLNFAALNCVSATGPTTYAVVGSLNKVPVALLGYLMFDSMITNETWFFICVSLCGGFLYSYAKIRQAGQKSSATESK